MQFGKVYIDPKANFSKEEFAALVKGQNIGGIDRHEAWKKYEAATEKKAKKQKEDKLPEWTDDLQQDTQI